MATDPIAKLRSVGRTLPPRVHAEVLALAPAIVPRLIDLLNDVDGGWASVHAADLLVDLKATETIEPMLRALAELDFDDVLFNRVVVRLPDLGALVLEPALAFLADHEDDEETVQSVCEVLGKLGVRDERIFEAVVDVFQRDEMAGATTFADYGDPRALPMLEGAVANFEPDFKDLWSRAQLLELVDAFEHLGGVLSPDVRERVDGWFAEWEARQRAAKAAGAPVQRRKVGRNDPCPCGSGKKYKKCCLAADEAARPHAVASGAERLQVSGDVSDEQPGMAREFFREKDAGRGPARQMADYARPILDSTDGSPGSMQAALNMAMIFWNLAVTRDEAEREESLADMARRLDEADRREFEETARMMIERHRALFPEMHTGA